MGSKFTDQFNTGIAGQLQEMANLMIGKTQVPTDTNASAMIGTLLAIIVANLLSTETNHGLVQLATAAEVLAGTNTKDAVTPAGLAAAAVAYAASASTTVAGIIELATDAEAKAETMTDRALTPSNLAALIATETQSGILETATDAEAITGTADDKIIVPDNLPAMLVALAHPILTSAYIRSTFAPIDYTHPSLSVGVYGTPVVDAAVVDNIAFTVNMSTATNKTGADTSSMAAFIGIKNTADVANNKMQGLLVSNGLDYDCFDAYAVQGHITIGALGMSTANPNAHLTGLSGKALLTGAVGQGWVTGVLGIIDGAGAVTGLCHAIAGQVEAGVGANVCDAILYLGADTVVPTAIELAGTANMTNFVKLNALAGFMVANELVPAAAPTALTVGADACWTVDVGGTPYYIPLYLTLHA